MKITIDAIKKLDELGAPNNYVAPFTEEERTYTTCFQQMCKKYNINFSEADEFERQFVMQQAERAMAKQIAV